MKEYYLIKCRNNIPFIIGQYDTEEDARKAKNRENPNSELMIVVNIEKEVRGTNTSYWGISALQAGHDDIRQDISKYLFRDCVVDSGHKGIIIGFEDNNQFFDYYYIVYVPELDKVVYQLCNDARFINSIEI